MLSFRYGVKRRAATDESLVQFFLHVDRVIAWHKKVATVAHNNTSRRLGIKKITELLPQS